eukprot:COSAG02_NODE_3433_length_6750_cov_29.777477_5_plen_72_part_01
MSCHVMSGLSPNRGFTGPRPGRGNSRGKSIVRHLYVWYYAFLEIRRRDAQDAENFISIGRNLDGKVTAQSRV